MKKLQLNGGRSNPSDGKKIAIIKQKITDAILDGKINNTTKDAEKFMYKIANELGINY